VSTTKARESKYVTIDEITPERATVIGVHDSIESARRAAHGEPTVRAAAVNPTHGTGAKVGDSVFLRALWLA